MYAHHTAKYMQAFKRARECACEGRYARVRAHAEERGGLIVQVDDFVYVCVCVHARRTHERVDVARVHARKVGD